MGTCGGDATVDDCNVCNGKNATKDCAGTCDGHAVPDCLDQCNGPAKPITYYRDHDEDKLGDPQATLSACNPPAGYVSNSDDCDDTRRARCTPTDRLRFKRKIPGSADLPWNQSALAGLGDVDGDRVPDLAIGDRIVFLNADATVKGQHRIVAEDLGPLPPLPPPSPSLGAGVTGLGDVDGDGVPDLAISEAPTWTSARAGATDVARVWLLLLTRSGVPNRSTLLAQPKPTTEGSCVYGSGFIVTWAGSISTFDAENDGKLELAAATTEDCANARVTGRVELFKLAPPALAGNGPTATSLSQIGYQVAPYGDGEFQGAVLLSAGDTNGDGAGDISVLTSTSKLWTLLLSRTGSLVGTARISATDTSDAFLDGMNRSYGPVPWLGQGAAARALVSLPRLTKFGGFMAARPASAQGVRSYRLYYPKELNVETRLAPTDGFGQAGASLGDLEDDGLPEVLVTAPGDDSGGTDLGAAYILGFAADCSNQTLRGDCNATAADGCETALTATDNCGACGQSCTGAPASSGGTCTNKGTCTLTCVEGFGDCNGDVRDGCETDLRTSVDHCGRCASKCSVRNHLLPVCSAGVCGVGTTCETLWSDCNPDAGANDGCESCGACNQATLSPPAPDGGYPPAAPCTRPDEVCQEQFFGTGINAPQPYARCMTVCPVGRGDCNGNPNDGCETNLALHDQCGSCNARCAKWSWLQYCVLNETGTGYHCR